jgi:hypothetical protein
VKAAIVPFDAVELFAADGTSIGHFLCISRWEGLAKFQSVAGHQSFICAEPSGLAALFDGLFARIDMTRKVDIEIISASPAIATTLSGGAA